MVCKFYEIDFVIAPHPIAKQNYFGRNQSRNWDFERLMRAPLHVLARRVLYTFSRKQLLAKQSLQSAATTEQNLLGTQRTVTTVLSP